MKMIEENIILEQGREPGDPIYDGYTLRITVSKKPEEPKDKEPVDPLLPSEDKEE